MQIKNLLKPSLLFFAGLMLSTSVLAKELTIYEQPKTDSKVTGSIDLSTGVIPIFTPKEGDWVKVADPRNGNVGWIKQSEMTNASGNAITFTQRFSTDSKGPETYQIIQYGKPQQYTTKEIEEMMQKSQMRQQLIQQSMQRTVQEMMKEISNYQTQWNSMLENANFPIIMPVVIVPNPTTSQPKQNQAKTNSLPASEKPATPVKK